MEAQRWAGTCPRSHSESVAESLALLDTDMKRGAVLLLSAPVSFPQPVVLCKLEPRTPLRHMTGLLGGLNSLGQLFSTYLPLWAAYVTLSVLCGPHPHNIYTPPVWPWVVVMFSVCVH